MGILDGGEYKSKGNVNESLQLSLHSSLVDVSDTLYTSFFDRLENCILTSATLKIQNSFDYFMGRIGLSNFGNVLTKDFLSPFLYNEQVNYHQYGGSREISNDPVAISELVYYLHKTFNKRIMVLFTSIKALSDTSKALQKKKMVENCLFLLKLGERPSLPLLKVCIKTQMVYYLEQIVFGKV